MPTELRPLGIQCNLRCCYCYQKHQRDAEVISQPYQMEMIKSALGRGKASFVLFGGEPLLVPETDLEDLWCWGLHRFGRNGIQTNGTLINENHIRMFKDYNVRVGISIDGPGELNDARWVRSVETTRNATANTEAAIRRLCKENVHTSLIVALHRKNATEEKLPQLTIWLKEMDQIGICSVRLHILEVDDPLVQKEYALSTEENIHALLHFSQVERELKRMSFDVFRDIRRLLVGRDGHCTCCWAACDPYSTASVRGLEGTGKRTICGRANKDGVDYVKSDTQGYERYIALYISPQACGGCKGCRYFLMCKGQCPGTAIAGDWRNRTEHCQVWKALFEHFEKEMQAEGNEQMLSDELRRVLEA